MSLSPPPPNASSTHRVVSLVPSVTETLSTWGVTPIACTRFCERPDLTHVGGTKNPDLVRIVALEPTLVVMDVEENRREDYEDLVARGLNVLATRVRSLDDVADALIALGRALDIEVATPRYDDAPTAVRRAFVPIWRRPYMALGEPTYGAALLRHLGVAVVGPGGPYAPTNLEDEVERHPDLVVAPSEPYPFSPRHHEELARVAPPYYVDGRDLFWWGTRTPGALERLRRALSAPPSAPGSPTE